MVEVRTFPQWSASVSRLIRDRSTNFVCNESILILTFDWWNLVLQDRPIQGKHLHLDHVRAYIYENHDLARNDHGSCKSFVDASLFQIMGQMIFFLLWSFPISVAMRSSLLDYVVWNREKVQCIFNDASAGCNFFQEVPACATDDAFTPVWWAFCALRLRVRLEEFKQLYVAHILNHLLCRRTERVVGFVLLKIALKSMSVRVVLDLLDQFTNTRVLSLFHNRMWQSRYSEVDVNLV